MLLDHFEYLQKNQNLYVYIYEWVDDDTFLKEINFEDDPICYRLICQKLYDAGWDGTGAIKMLWLPPFVIQPILDEPIGYGFNILNFWTKGLILWHVKQQKDGLSFILSLKKLNIPDFGLE